MAEWDANQTRAIYMIRLARNLGRLDFNLQHWRVFLTDDDDGNPPAVVDKALILQSIARVRAYRTEIGNADTKAIEVLRGRLRIRVVKQLVLLAEALGQPDIPAEIAQIDGDYGAALHCLYEAGRRARRLCKRIFAHLEARVLAHNAVFMASQRAAGVQNGERAGIIDLPPGHLMKQATIQQQAILELLWAKPVIRMSEFSAELWPEAVTNDAVEKAIQRFNTKFLDFGCIIAINGNQVAFTRPTK